MNISALCEGVIELRNINGFSFTLTALRDNSALFCANAASFSLSSAEYTPNSRYAIHAPLSVG